MEVKDPKTFVLTLSQPYPPALQELAYIRPVRLLSPKSVDEEGLYTKPVGTGPWVLETSDRNGAAFKRNESLLGHQAQADAPRAGRDPGRTDAPLGPARR